MMHDVRKVSAAQFVMVSELLDHAFPRARAVPDYLSHDCERAEQALLTAMGKTGFTSDETLAELFALGRRV